MSVPLSPLLSQGAKSAIGKRLFDLLMSPPLTDSTPFADRVRRIASAPTDVRAENLLMEMVAGRPEPLLRKGGPGKVRREVVDRLREVDPEFRDALRELLGHVDDPDAERLVRSKTLGGQPSDEAYAKMVKKGDHGLSDVRGTREAIDKPEWLIDEFDVLDDKTGVTFGDNYRLKLPPNMVVDDAPGGVPSNAIREMVDETKVADLGVSPVTMSRLQTMAKYPDRFPPDQVESALDIYLQSKAMSGIHLDRGEVLQEISGYGRKGTKARQVLWDERMAKKRRSEDKRARKDEKFWEEQSVSLRKGRYDNEYYDGIEDEILDDTGELLPEELNELTRGKKETPKWDLGYGPKRYDHSLDMSYLNEKTLDPTFKKELDEIGDSDQALPVYKEALKDRVSNAEKKGLISLPPGKLLNQHTIADLKELIDDAHKEAIRRHRGKKRPKHLSQPGVGPMRVPEKWKKNYNRDSINYFRKITGLPELD